jgi:non-specific serine/threonine protein kinase
MPAPSTDTPPPAPAHAVRSFGRLRLLRLLGKSERTMAWRVADPATEQHLMLVLPRVQPPDAAAIERWLQAVRKAARLSHPNLAAAVEIGVRDGWPYVTYDPRDDLTLADRRRAQGLPGAEVAALAVQTLQGLAFAHDAGMAHQDLQPFLLLVSDGGGLRVAGLAVTAEAADRKGDEGRHGGPEPAALRSQRDAAERDVLAAGVLMHSALTGEAALDELDIGRVIQRLPPLGREIVRLPWTTAHPVAEPLRAIVNRATDRQERQRYRNARTMLRALEGWLQTESSAGGGPYALLADRLRSAGVLPCSPGAAARAARLTLMERERTYELAEVVLEDLALSFELLRLVNSVQVRGTQVSGSGPVLTVRRAITMVGLNGVRRAALALRVWPGPLQGEAADELERLIERCKRAGRLALMLRPAGYDSEVVYLLTLLQNLGRLVVQYHFADEAQQIRRLMQPGPPLRAGEPEEPGMSEGVAAFAVLGADIEAIGAAVARHWGLDDHVLGMIRRHPAATPVRAADGDDDILRTVASCANDAVDALAQPAPRVPAALQRVVQRYGRVLDLTLRDLQAALQGRPAGAAAPAAPAPLAAAPTAPAPLESRPTRPGSLRATAVARSGRVPEAPP